MLKREMSTKHDMIFQVLEVEHVEWKVPGLNLTMGKVSEKVSVKKFWKTKKKASYPLLAWWKSGWWECSPTRKKSGVCAIMSIWLVHIKEHVWTVRTCPTTILLSAVTTCECVCEWQQWRRLYQEDLHAAWGMQPVCSPGSWSGRGWHPLILVWHSQKWLALAANVKWSWKLMAKLTGCYIKSYSYSYSKAYGLDPVPKHKQTFQNMVMYMYQ